MNLISLILTWILTWISKQIVVILTGLVALFTGLYWWNARRAFLLELDRVLLWVRSKQRITDEEADKLIEEGINEHIDKMIDEKIDKMVDESTLRPNELVREELKSQVRGDVREIREKMRQGIRKDMRRKMMIHEIVEDEVFLNTLKSKKLAARIKNGRKKKN